MAPLVGNVPIQDDGSSMVSSSPLKTFSSMSIPPPSPYSPWMHELKSDERGLCLIHLLLSCANHVAAGILDRANAFLEQIALLAAPDGDAMQRIASHFSEALAWRALRQWRGLYRALDCVPPVAEAAAARRHFFDLCPFLRVSYVVSNQAIMEAMEGEKVVHIVDLNASDPTQWLFLLQGLRARPEGPPHLKITGVHEHLELLNHTAVCLYEEAERLDIPFQFNPVATKLENLDVESLRPKTGEALAISSVLQLHTLLATETDQQAAPAAVGQQLTLGESLDKDHSPNSDSVIPSSPAESFLASLWGLSPNVLVVTELEADHNGGALSKRFVEALFYYAALAVRLPRLHGVAVVGGAAEAGKSAAGGGDQEHHRLRRTGEETAAREAAAVVTEAPRRCLWACPPQPLRAPAGPPPAAGLRVRRVQAEGRRRLLDDVLA